MKSIFNIETLYRRLAPWIFAALFVSPALAAGTTSEHSTDDTTPVALPSITVTAEKAPMDLQDTTVSITAFSEKRIKDADISTFKDAALSVPNLFVSNWGTRGISYVFVRGVGAVNNDPAVGFYVDGVNLMDARLFDLGLYDIERIEILRGPQGTLYGRNSLAGVVNIITRPPANEFSAEVTQSVGNYSAFITAAGLNAPLATDTLYLKLSGSWEVRDGYKHNDYLDRDVDERDDLSGRMNLRYTPGRNLDISFTLNADRYRDGAYPLSSLVSVRENPDKVAYDFEGWSHHDAVGATLDVAWDAPWFRLTAISALHQFEDDVANDQDFTPWDLATAHEKLDHDQVSQELRLSSPDDEAATRWLAGLYGFSTKRDYYLMMRYAQGVLGPVYPEVIVHNDSDIETRGYAAFGQVTRSIVGGLGVTAGLRYDYEKSEIAYTSETVLTGMGSVPSAFDGQRDESAWLPKFQVHQDLGKEAMVYAGVARGYRSAGFNTALTEDSERSFDPEYSWNYEVGLKSAWLANRLTVNGAIFYIDLEDQQVTQLISTGDTLIRNAGKSRSVGFEVETAALLAEGIRLEAGFGYTDAEFKRHADPLAGTDYSGNKTPLAPEYTGSLALQYRRDANLGGLFAAGNPKLFARAEVQAVGSFFWNEANTLRQDAYELVNLSVGFETDRFELKLRAENLFDTGYEAVAFEFTEDNPLGEAGTPRTFLAGVAIRF